MRGPPEFLGKSLLALALQFAFEMSDSLLPKRELPLQAADLAVQVFKFVSILLFVLLRDLPKTVFPLYQKLRQPGRLLHGFGQSLFVVGKSARYLLNLIFFRLHRLAETVEFGFHLLMTRARFLGLPQSGFQFLDSRVVVGLS